MRATLASGDEQRKSGETVHSGVYTPSPMSASRHGGKILVLSSRAPERNGATDRGATAEIVWLPALAIVPRQHEMKVKLLDLRRYHGVVFTSVHAVEVFVASLRSIDQDARALAGIRIAAVGGETAAALRARLLEPDLVGDGGGAVLAKALLDAAWSGTLLYPQAADGRPELVETLRGGGIAVDVVVAYDAIVDDQQLAAALTAHRKEPFAAIALGSPRIAERWLALSGDTATRYGVLGATTAATLERFGITPVIAPTPNLEALVRALAQSFTVLDQIE